MPTIAELRSIIRGQLTGQVPVDDVRLRDRWIDQVMHQQRALLIAQYGRGTGVPQSYYQIIDCLEIQCGEVECYGIKSGVKHNYIVVPLISSIRDAVSYLGTVDGQMNFTEMSLSGFNAQGGRFGRKPPAFTLIQDKALLKDLPPVKIIRLVAVLYNPSHGLCGQSIDDFLYPIDDEDIAKLTTLSIKQIASTLNIPPDIQNDAAGQVAPSNQR